MAREKLRCLCANPAEWVPTRGELESAVEENSSTETAHDIPPQASLRKPVCGLWGTVQPVPVAATRTDYHPRPMLWSDE